MTEAHHTEVIEAPIAAVYQQWLDVESFSRFIPAVKAVTTSADVYSHWTLSIGSPGAISALTREFDAEITEQLPEERVSWRTLSGDLSLTGSATFAEPAEGTTEVTLSVTWAPKSAAEHAAATLGVDDRIVTSALREFKHYVETHDGPSGHSYVTLRSVDPTDS